jgi:enterobactin synthetase component D
VTLLRSEQLELAHGTCVLVELADVDAALAALSPEEQAHAAALGDIRRREFISGRTALRLALGTTAPILGDPRGAPIVPAGYTGSISHKGALAVALAAPLAPGHVGIDLELAAPPRQDIARRILTPGEQAALGDDRGKSVTLRFAIKEAIYKAVDPYLRRYVGFLEVELDVRGDGTALVTSALPLAIEATWREHAGHWLATARARDGGK